MTGTLPEWLANWLGVEPSAPGESATWRLDLTWPWPPWATVLLVLAAVVWVSFCYHQEQSLAGRGYRALLAALRYAAIAALVAMLTQAAITLQRSGPPTIAVIVDNSSSMTIVDSDQDSQLQQSISERLRRANIDGATRLDLAKLLLVENDARLMKRLFDDYRPSFYLAAGGTERLPAEDAASLTARLRAATADGPASNATRLGDAVRHVLDDARSAPPAGILIFTDGEVTAGATLADAAQDARSRGVPIVAIGLGSDRAPRDIQLVDVLVDDTAFIDDVLSFQIEIKSTGLTGESARVVLHREGDATPLAEQSITLGHDGEPQTVLLTHRPTAAGEIAYVVEIAPREDETNVDNNRQRRVVTVRDDKIRVLLAFGYPSYEFRFLKTLLERDSTIQLATFLQDADPDYAEQDRTALRSIPVSRDELFEYDVLVLGDLNPRLVPRSLWPDVRAFVVEKGGGVAFVAGPRYLPWMYADVADVAGLLPFDVDALAATGGTLPDDVSRGFVVTPTELGRRLPPLQLGDTPAETEQIWRSLSPLYWLVQIDKLKPAAQVLAEHPTHTNAQGRHLPVLVSQFVGAGRVLFQATDSTWRWRIGVGDPFFARYWVQTIRYLARGKLANRRGAELTVDRREYHRGEAAQVRLRFLDSRFAPAGDEVSVVVEAPGQAHREITLHRNPAATGVFEASLPDLTDGQYELLLTEPQMPGNPPSARFAVTAPAGELARTQMDRAALTAAAETTRGKFYTIADADRLVDELPHGRRMPLANLPPLELWNQWWLLASFLTLLTLEWILRKRKGML